MSILYHQVYRPHSNVHEASGHVQLATINFEDCLFNVRKCGNTQRHLVSFDRMYPSGHEYYVRGTSLCKDVAFHVALLNHEDVMLWNASSTVNEDGYHQIKLEHGNATGSYRSVEVYLDRHLSSEKMYQCQTSETDNPFIMWAVELIEK